MTDSIQNRTVKIFIDDQDVQKKLDKARAKMEQLQERAKKTDVGSESFSKLNEEINKTQKAITTYEGQLSGKFGASVTQLKEEQKKLNRELANMPVELRASSEAAKKLSLVEAALRGARTEGKGLVDQLRNFGPLGNQIADIWTGFSDGIRKAVGMMSTLKGAIAATGIGLLVVAFGTLYNWLTKTDDGMVALDGIFRTFRATLDVILNRLFNFRDTIREFIANPIQFFKTLGDDIKNAGKEAFNLAKVFDDLDDRRRSMELTASELDKQIAQYVRQSKNMTLTFKERIELIDKAANLERQKLSEQLKYQNAYIAAIKAENDLAEKSGHLSDDMKDKLNSAMIERNRMQEESIRLDERLNNDRDRYMAEEIERTKKVTEEQAKAAAKRAEKEQKAFSDKMTEQIENARRLHEMELEIMGEQGVDVAMAELEALNARRQNWKDFEEDIKRYEEERNQKTISNLESYASATITIANSLNSFLNNADQVRLRSIENNYAQEKAILDSNLKNKLISQEQYDAQLAELEKKSSREQKAIMREQAEREKKLAVLTSTIQAALAIIKAYLIPTPSNILAAIGAGVQAAVIAATPIPEFAKGTDFAPGGMALVGEQGPELVQLPRGTKVFTATQTRSMMPPADFNYGRMTEAARTVTNIQNVQNSAPDPELRRLMANLNERLSQPLPAMVVIGERELYKLRTEINKQSQNEDRITV